VLSLWKENGQQPPREIEDLGPICIALSYCVICFKPETFDAFLDVEMRYLVSITIGYGLEGRRSIPGRGKIFSLFHSVQRGSVCHTAFYPMITNGSFLEVNTTGS
jgi:hypothetical protein